MRRLLNYSGLNFVAALLLSASYRCEREFVPQSIFTYLIPCNSPKGIVFSAYIDDMIKEYEDKRLKIEESIPVFFDNIIFLLKSMTDKNLCYKNISIGPYTLKFVAPVLFLGKYYE